MGYFSRLALECANYDGDRSYPSPEMQLLWRLEDLHAKREELIRADTPYRRGTYLTDTDIRYAVPDYFESIAGVERAIELAIDELKYNYGIDVTGERDDRTSEQISLFDSIPSPPLPEPLNAA